MAYKTIISSKIAVGGLIILLAFLGYLKFQQYRGQAEIEKEKNSLMEQAQTLSKKNDDLNQSLAFLNTPEFKERLARQQLNLKKDGETVYNFTNEPSSQNSLDLENQAKNNRANWQKWVDYFTQR